MLAASASIGKAQTFSAGRASIDDDVCAARMPCRTGLTGVGRCTIDGSTSCTEGERRASDATIAGPVLRIYNNSDGLSYDPAKRDWTLAHRGLDFEDAWLVFSGRTAEVEDIRRNYGELRILCFGMLMGRMVVIGYTPRGAVRHVFSMRKANEREKARYAPYLGL